MYRYAGGCTPLLLIPLKKCDYSSLLRVKGLGLSSMALPLRSAAARLSKGLSPSSGLAAARQGCQQAARNLGSQSESQGRTASEN